MEKGIKKDALLENEQPVKGKDVMNTDLNLDVYFLL